MLVVVAGLLLLRPTITSEEFLQRRGEIVEVTQEAPRREVGGFISQGVRLKSDAGLAVYLRVLRPAEITEPLPLVVVLGGHRTGRDAVGLLGAPGPLVVAALDYPYHGPERPRGWRESTAAIRQGRRALPDTPPAVLLALEWLLTQPWVNADQAELMGVSLGVPFAAVAGALDQRFQRVWLVHGAGDNRGWIAHNLADRVRPAWASRALAGLLHCVARGHWFEAEDWVREIAPRPMVIIGATEDERLPAGAIPRLVAAAGESAELLWTEGGHMDRRPEQVELVMALARERILGLGGGGE